ncbi:MAG: hypothetical protein VB012_00245 [Erysipelotrichaceae bacterium]|nr:hypothetical protein [Erysipelotrichaceae bacterium]
MPKSDLLITILFIIAMVILYFLGWCFWDIPALIFGLAVAAAVYLLWRNKKRQADKQEQSKQ